MKLAFILLAALLFATGSALPTHVKIAHASPSLVQSSQDARKADVTGGRFLRSSERVNEANEERGKLAGLFLLDDITAAQKESIKKLAPTFAKLNEKDDGAIDLFDMLIRQGHSVKSAEKAGDLYTIYLRNPSAFHAS
ncbi:hypothetical protein F441_19396 [Phytophthora nicotianae CJ01A1]|uniref:RxLR effector protein n=5 Tax=Phytophthora nicotianae TaxID=4792 RepID=V9E3S2_PHYNI|nr:hypothetical protein F443_19581 [Phytophthora nicotianae P1569]ETK74136.1 hypothetical protein L915_18993 [Phytophthora nicotianae]ETO62572.1 hypothetical protein F444_19526 [Phytophthora nicotianae P1976]ETP03661.1 hypothetical protein F441_19396 [Phytophthora nicotianae CJ01A1]ETP31817.1 hypothetical protein F442_19347 [Phytophthora nicotianae P10297]KUF99012.1 hypothetical protein AM587_10006996 [Phytophthora nicotianae]